MEEKPNGVPSTPSPEGTVGSEGKLGRGERAYNSPKHSKNTWLKIRLEYELGDWSSVKELSEKHGVNYKTLFTRITTENWREKRQDILLKAESKVQKAVVQEASKQEVYLQRLSGRAEKYERIIDASLEQLGSKDAQGVSLLDLEAIDVVTRSEQRLVEMQKVALRIAPLSQLDITSGGKDLGTSFVQAIAKLRGGGADTPKLQSQDLDKVLEAEVE